MITEQSGGTIGDVEVEYYVSEGISPLTPRIRYGGIAYLGGKSSTDNVDAFLIFHLKLRASNLLVSPYNEYQQFLYETITKFLEKGWNYQQIADWFNDNGFTTPRGKKFGNAHAHSIVKKKKIRDVRLNKTYEAILSNFSLQFVDKTLINQ